MPYGYDVANAKLPQAADPIGSLMQGGVQGITLGLGLQRARQDAQTNQLQQQAAQEEIKNKELDMLGKAAERIKKAESPILKQFYWDTYFAPIAKNRIGTEIDIPDEYSEQYEDSLGALAEGFKNAENDKEKDIIFGRVLSDAQKRGENLDSLFKYREAVMPKKNVLTDYQLKSLENQKENRDLRIDNQILQYSNQLENNYILKDLNKQQIGFNQVNDLIGLTNSGNTIAANALGMKMARGLGEVGVLTESDISRYVQSGQLNRAVADKLSRWVNGKPTDATVEEIGQISNVLKQSWDSKVQPIYNRYVERLSKNYEIPIEEAADRLGVPYKPISSKENNGNQLPDLQNTTKSFKSVAEAEAANLPPGTIIEINGRRARVE